MDEIYETAFNLILCAGNAKSKSMMALQAARESRFEEADQLLLQASDEFAEAHEIQNTLIQAEAGGQKAEVNLILVHAQDHLTMALMAQDNAKEFVNLYKMIHELREAK